MQWGYRETRKKQGWSLKKLNPALLIVQEPKKGFQAVGPRTNMK